MEKPLDWVQNWGFFVIGIAIASYFFPVLKFIAAGSFFGTLIFSILVICFGEYMVKED